MFKRYPESEREERFIFTFISILKILNFIFLFKRNVKIMNYKLFRGIFHPPYVRIRDDVEISAKRPQKI